MRVRGTGRRSVSLQLVVACGDGRGCRCGVVLFVLAPQIASWYGFRGESASLAPRAVFLLRTLACAMPFMGLMMMMNTHYLVVRHVLFAVSVTVMKDFVCPCAGVLVLGATLGERGLWIGFAAGYAVAACYPFLAVRICHGRDLFPWLIERDDGRSIDFTVRLTADTLADAKVRIGEFLNGHDVFETGGMLATIEAAGRETLAANARRVLCEYFVFVGDEGAVRIVVRDNGKPLPSAQGTYLNTLGCNRTDYGFSLPQRSAPRM